MKSTDNKLQLR